MKLRPVISIFLLVASTIVNAQTKIVDDGEKISAILSENDSLAMYSILQVKEQSGRSGVSKFYTTLDEVFTLQCTLSYFSESNNPRCVISISYDRSQTSQTRLQRDEDKLIVEFDKIDSKSLYDIMSTTDRENEKYFYSEDKKALISCVKVAIPARTIFQCRTQIDVK